MLLTGYTREIFRPECNPSFESVHCIAHLNEDVGKVLPYLKVVLGGAWYFNEPTDELFYHNGRRKEIQRGIDYSGSYHKRL